MTFDSRFDHKLKVLQVNTYDVEGGAARAAYRIHRALIDHGIDSQMRVRYGRSDDVQVKAGQPPLSRTRRTLAHLQRRWVAHRRRAWHTADPGFHTFGEQGAGIVAELNNSDADILNLHWFSNLLSVKDVGRLTKPIVWTLHDMWAFCGGEHYASDGESARFREGYLACNRPKHESGPDLNRHTWELKREQWSRQRFHIVSPSNWLARCARESKLLRECRISVIPNPIDLTAWRPISKSLARHVLGLDPEAKIVLVGAEGGLRDPRKGGDLATAALALIAGQKIRPDLVLVFGQSSATTGSNPGVSVPVKFMGRLYDDMSMVLAYNAADVMLIPSRQDNLPNTAVEAQACGTPVVAFNVGGIPDIVSHRETGWLAAPLDVAGLAAGITWVLEDGARAIALGSRARNMAVERFSSARVAECYSRLYEELLRAGPRTA